MIYIYPPNIRFTPNRKNNYKNGFFDPKNIGNVWLYFIVAQKLRKLWPIYLFLRFWRYFSIGAHARTHASTASYILNWKWRGTSQSNYLVHKWSLMIKFENSNMPMLLLGTTPMCMQKMNSISAAVNAWLRRERTDRQTDRQKHTSYIYIDSWCVYVCLSFCLSVRASITH